MVFPDPPIRGRTGAGRGFNSPLRLSQGLRPRAIRNGVNVISPERFLRREGISLVVDFVLKKTPKYRVASVRFVAPYNEKRIRSELEGLARWAKAKGLRTGKWFFSEDGSGPRYRFEVAIEVRGAAKSEGKVHLRTFPASPAASVTFDPDVVSARVVYHGLNDWLRWRKKEKEIKRVRTYREVYDGNPWTDAKAWAHTEIQVLVTK